MKSLQDALYNWLSIKVVCDARPDDKAAQATFQLFDNKLKEEFGVEEIVRVEKDEVMYIVHCKASGKERSLQFPIELIDFMLDAIEKEPEKYSIYNEQ